MISWVPTRAVLIAVWLGTRAFAEPAPPISGPEVDHLEIGVFCASEAMGQAPAPGTRSGFVHVPKDEISFHWPDRQMLPAALGLAFGVKVQMISGVTIPDGEMRVYRPEDPVPESWGTGFSDLGQTLGFFRFDHADELTPGLWRLEGWDGARRLFSVAFEVVPASALPEIAKACDAVS